VRRGMDTPKGVPVGNADRAPGLGQPLRNGQAQTSPRRTHLIWSNEDSLR
jgi:hypothetical protein